MKEIRSAILLLFAIVPAALAQQITYSTNFDNTTDFPAGEALSSFTTAELPANDPNPDLDWITSNTSSDAMTPEPTDSILPDTSSYAEYMGDQWAIEGGAVGRDPSQNLVNLWNPVSIAGGFNFSTEFGVTESSGFYTNNDAFGITFLNTSANTSYNLGDDLVLQILFTPDPENPSTILDVDWNTGGSETSSGLTISRDAKYDIQVLGNLAAGTFMSTISSVGVESSGTFGGSFEAGETLGGAAVTWDILNPGNAGNNSILFNDYSVIPEPSAVISLVLGGMGLVIWQRRSRKGLS